MYFIEPKKKRRKQHDGVTFIMPRLKRDRSIAPFVRARARAARYIDSDFAVIYIRAHVARYILFYP